MWNTVIGLGSLVELVVVKVGSWNCFVDKLVDVKVAGDERIRRRRSWSVVARLVAAGDLHS